MSAAADANRITEATQLFKVRCSFTIFTSVIAASMLFLMSMQSSESSKRIELASDTSLRSILTQTIVDNQSSNEQLLSALRLLMNFVAVVHEISDDCVQGHASLITKLIDYANQYNTASNTALASLQLVANIFVGCSSDNRSKLWQQLSPTLTS